MDRSDATNIFGVLKNAYRLKILTTLAQGEMNVSELSDRTQIEQSVLSHHLKRLRDVELVRMRKDGQFHFFSVAHDRAAPFLQPIAPDVPAERPNELIYVWDVETGKQHWYGDVDHAFGYEPGQFPRTVDAWEQHVHPEDYPRVLEAAERHLRDGIPFVQQYRIKRRDGTYSTWLDTGSAMTDSAKRPYKWVGMTRELQD
jgi:DNA-binding transcriptional ArsR family regulator